MDDVHADIPQRDRQRDRPRESGRREPETRDRQPPDQPARKRTPWLLIAAGAVLAVLVVGGGVLYWLATRDYETTSDAQVAGNVTQISARVSGRVMRLLFADNQHVTAGQKLLELDPRDLQAKLDQALAQQAGAAAQVKQAAAQLGVQKANLDQAKANVTVAEADLTQAQQDYTRFHHVNPAAVTRQQIDQADATLRSQTARLAAAKQAVEGAQAQIETAQAQAASAAASLSQAKAVAEAARLQLSYTVITAPAAGRVTYRSVNLGDYIQPGQALFALVQDDLWVEADFKETQLAHMRPGQPVTISVDAVPGATFHGQVNSVQAGTGSRFSALPAENATGNWVKVVQRLPVKITFDDDSYARYLLAPGMSAEPSVKVR